MAAQEKEI
jgi:multidrug efflux pump subunit AcrA (membrane-fusion protein)